MKPYEQLVRKQISLYPEQIKKLAGIARKEGTSIADIVRTAIDEYNPDISTDIIDPKLLDLVSARVKEALADTKQIRQKLNNTLKALNID